MNNEHPITPPPELVQQWINEENGVFAEHIATQAARWGADQQLEQCEKYWMTHGISPQGVVAMRYALRPKPASLKETLLARVARIPGEGADSAYLQHWLENESQRLVESLHKAIKFLPD